MLFLDSVHLCTLMSVTAAAAAVNQVAATVRRAGQCVSARASEICGSLIAVRGGKGQGTKYLWEAGGDWGAGDHALTSTSHRPFGIGLHDRH